MFAPAPAATVTAVEVSRCCGSRRWAERVCAGLPYPSAEAARRAAETAFDGLAREDWLEAFSAHSAIGAVRAGDRTGAAEQSGIAAADPELAGALAAANAEYRSRHGFVFLIRAHGRGAEEILAQLRLRLANPPAVEFANACAQQREITALRLDALLGTAAESSR